MARQTTDGARDHMARITVTDKVWGEFREAARVRGISVTSYLAQLVSDEVTKLRADAAKAETLTARHAAAALADARSLRDDLGAIADRLEILTRHPNVLEMALEPRPDRRSSSARLVEERWEIRDGGPERVAPDTTEPLPDDWMLRNNGSAARKTPDPVDEP